jgi:hypothetical protein
MLTLHVLQIGTTVFAYNNGGCPFASLQPERETGACPGTTADAAADILARAHAGDVLFLPSLRLARWSNQFTPTDEARAWIATTGASALAARRAAEAPAVALLSPLAAHGMHIVFDAPKPLFRAPPFRCADWFNASNPICRPGLSVERAKFEDYRRPVVDSLARISTQVSGVSIFDPLPILCPGKTCEVTRDSRPLYFDGDHLSGYANDLLLPEFEKFIDGLARAQP